ncbi:MAG TPA: hypothetical protein VIR62_00400 [Allosphingosinicella sp.]
MAISLALGGVAEAAPKRVASLNLCTDQLLLLLAAPEQIVSVTHLSHKQAETPLWKRARHYEENDGSLLSVVGHRPDLVLTMGGGARDWVGIAEQLDIATLDLPFPQGIEDIEASISAVARALGREGQGRRLIARIDHLQRSRPKRQHDTVWLGGGGRSVASKGLAAQWMALAGFRQRPLKGDRISLEQLLIRPPQILLRSDYRQGQYSGEQRWLNHPLAKGTERSRTIITDGRPWTCMGPLMLDEIRRLRQEMAE